MILGCLNRRQSVAVDDADGRVRIANFSLGPAGGDALLDLPHAAAATPGRYLAEMLRRLGDATPDRVVAACNPLVDFSANELGLLVHALRAAGAPREGFIVEDVAGLPLAYCLPRTVDAGCFRFLGLLSCVATEVDAALLAALSGQPPRRHALSIAVRPATGPDEFYITPAASRTYRGFAHQATQALQAAGPGDRAALRLAAVMPFNAGDVLFAALAWQRSQGHCSALVVDRRYAGIAREAAPDLELIVIDLQPHAVDGVLDWEWALAEYIESGLPAGHVYSYCRPSRRYDRQPVHLIDQYAFGMGDPCRSGSYRGSRPEPFAVVPRLGGPKTIFMHFDGGWPMKIYPLHWQRELVVRCLDAGCRIVCLTERSDQVDARVEQIRFSTLADLRAGLLESDLVIGMDSFPAHYATHVLGKPTLCLFSSTQPANSDAPPHAGYRALHQGLECTPCGTYSRCPRYGGDACWNFLSPDRVAEIAIAMLEHGREVVDES